MSNDERSDRQALEALVVDNHELERLEALLDQFNLFEAIGAVRQELRHSDFLAFLLDPKQSHGLGELFARRLLQRVVRDAAGEVLPVSAVELALWELDSLEVRREWQNIDILLADAAHPLVVILENKVGSQEHSQQLQRYWQIVEQHFAGWSIVGLFLTPDGDPPSDARYQALSYQTIQDLLVELADTRASTLGPDVRTAILHYTQMLRRHILSDSEIAQLCRLIYRKHQRALDLIYEHRPDLQAQLRELLEALVVANPSLLLAHSSKSYLYFFPEEWDHPHLNQGTSHQKRLLLFTFENRPTTLNLRLYIAPGAEAVRAGLYELAGQHPPLRLLRPLTRQWTTIYLRTFLKPLDYEEATLDELQPKIEQAWETFLSRDLPSIREAIQRGLRPGSEHVDGPRGEEGSA